MTVRVALVDDHPIVLAGLVDLIGRRAEYEVVATGSSADEALHLVDRHAIDLLILDLNMPGDTRAVLRRIRDRADAPLLLVFTAADSVQDCLATMEAGASGYVVKGSSGGELFHAMANLLKGEDYISVSLASRVVRAMQQAARQPDPRDEVALSYREEQIVEFLLRGESNRGIADRLKLSENTVKYYMSQIMQKFSARNRLEVVLAVQRQRGAA